MAFARETFKVNIQKFRIGAVTSSVRCPEKICSRETGRIRRTSERRYSHHTEPSRKKNVQLNEDEEEGVQDDRT